LLGYYIKHIHSLSGRNLLIISALMVLIYFSHAFMYLLCLFAFAIVFFIQLFLWEKKEHRLDKRRVLKTALGLLLASLPSAFLFILFYLNKQGSSFTYLDTSEIWKMFTRNNSFIWFGKEEKILTTPLQLAFC